MKYSINTPLTRTEIKRLPLGFTETSVGLTGQEIKRAQRLRFRASNRIVTDGRRIQYIPYYRKDKEDRILMYQGEPILAGTRKIFHMPTFQINNKRKE